MTLLPALLPIKNILLDLDIGKTADLFDRIGQFFAQHHPTLQHDIVNNLLAREALGSTGLGRGVAIPHGRIKGLSQPQAAIVRTCQPLSDFSGPDGVPVSLFFFLLVPEQATEQHLEILSEIAQLLSDHKIREIFLKESVENISMALLS